MANQDPFSNPADKVTKRAATLVETAADLAGEAFETAVERADVASATTADKLTRGARQTNQFVRRYSRPIGIGTMIIGALGLVAILALVGSRRQDNMKSDQP